MGSTNEGRSTFTAGVALTNFAFHCGKMSADKTMIPCAAATDVCVGIFLDAPPAGAGVTVQSAGRIEAMGDGSGTAISAGDRVGPDANARLVQRNGVGQTYCAIALTGLAAVGIFEISFIGSQLG